MRSERMEKIRRTKLDRMNKLLDAINEHERTFGELRELLPDVKERRTIHNYLNELKGLGLVFYDEKTRRYSRVGLKKKEYASKHDYEVALKHSEKLTLSDHYNQRFDAMEPDAAIDILVFGHILGDDPFRQFRQHLQTGYYDVHLLLKKYKERMTEAGYAQRPSIPKLGPPILLAGFPEPEKAPEEIIPLQKKLIGEVYYIVAQVQHGIPLKGSCDLCPHRVFTIKE